MTDPEIARMLATAADVVMKGTIIALACAVGLAFLRPRRGPR